MSSDLHKHLHFCTCIIIIFIVFFRAIELIDQQGGNQILTSLINELKKIYRNGN